MADLDMQPWEQMPRTVKVDALLLWHFEMSTTLSELMQNIYYGLYKYLRRV